LMNGQELKCRGSEQRAADEVFDVVNGSGVEAKRARGRTATTVGRGPAVVPETDGCGSEPRGEFKAQGA
jgi:hypothetical protein